MAEQNLSESIYAALSERILRWDYLPGRRLTEEALCAEFEVSRSPVREALHMLAENGLIERRARQGYSVRLLDFKEINELYELRLAIEEYVVGRLCREGLAQERLAGFEEHWRRLLEGLPGTAGLVPSADEEFHESLAGLIGNGAVLSAMRDIDRRIHFVRLSDITSPERVLATCREHLELLAAVGGRETEAALRILRQNIEGGRSSVEKAVKEALAHAYSRGD